MADVPGQASDWRPTAALSALHARATLLAQVRAFFAARGVLEVETPVLGRHTVTEPGVESIALEQPAGRRWYLQTSPEYAMKRLLAAGAGDIFQICKVFRQSESGRRHSPEFTLLEWYRRDMNWDGFILECVALLQELLPRWSGVPARHWTYRELLRGALGADPFTATDGELAGALAVRGVVIGTDATLPRAALLDLAYDHAVRAAGAGIHTVRDFPPAAAALARIVTGADGSAVAERCELLVDGVEIGNGYHELRDAGEQARRFASDRGHRRAAGQDDVAPDPRLLAALAAGLPECCGMAIGLDRVLMCALGVAHIDAVLAFAGERA